jgi:hypothetical protein
LFEINLVEPRDSAWALRITKKNMIGPISLVGGEGEALQLETRERVQTNGSYHLKIERWADRKNKIKRLV